jgi:hypothetical protein
MSATELCSICNTKIPLEAMRGDQCRECNLRLGGKRHGSEKFRKISGYERILDKYKSRRTKEEFKRCEEIAEELVDGTV